MSAVPQYKSALIWTWVALIGTIIYANLVQYVGRGVPLRVLISVACLAITVIAGRKSITAFRR